MSKTKIIATLGPASQDRAVLLQMMKAGLDVVRINFSHADRKSCLRLVRTVRELNKKYRRRLKILGDLEGPRIRIGELAKPIELKKNQVYFLTNTKKSTAARDTSRKKRPGSRLIPFDYPGRLKDIAKGLHVYIDDGNLALKVEGHRHGCLVTRVVVGGLLKEHKGVNVPGAKLRFTSPTASDRRNLEFCVQQRLDWIAQSFVRGAGDIQRIKMILAKRKNILGMSGRKIRDFSRAQYQPCLIAKVENEDGVQNLDGIIKAADGVMVARGDLGVSLPIWEVPLIQKEIIRKCRKAGKIAVTATQMLESMKENLRPERAEVSDVANAVLDGSDYLMLSAETSVGRYPVESVRMMEQVIRFTEKNRRAAGC